MFLLSLLSTTLTIISMINGETLETSDFASHEKSHGTEDLMEHSMLCDSKPDGIYANYDSDCKKFYVCEKNQMYNFDCPQGTRFYERFESCSFVPPEEIDHFVCSTPNQLKDSGNRQSLHRDGHSIDFDDSHIIDRRGDERQTVKGIHRIQVNNERDLDYLKEILRDNQWFPASSHLQGGADDDNLFVMQQHASEREDTSSKFHHPKEIVDEEDAHTKQQPYEVVPIKGHNHEYGEQDHTRALESILAPLLQPKPKTRESKKNVSMSKSCKFKTK